MIQILDALVTMLLLVVGCVLGKYCMVHHDTWLAFNGPELGTLTIGELIWWRIRKIVLQKDNLNGKD